LHENFFSGCKDSLESIDFSSNSIERLGQTLFKECPNLQIINFTNNKLKELDENLFKDCKKELFFIDFSYNQIDLLSQGIFKECESLRCIFLNNNELKNLNGDEFQGCNDLIEINFSCNRLKNLGNFNFEKFTFQQLHCDSGTLDINFSNNFLTSIPYFSTNANQKYRIDLRDNLDLLDSFQLLFRKLDKSKRDKKNLQPEEKVENKLKDKDIVLNRQNNIQSLLFLIVLNSKIYNNKNKEDFKIINDYFRDLEQEKMSVLDVLIRLGNECFSNHNLFHLNEAFEIEFKKTPNLVNFEFRMTNAETIEALCERNDYSTFKKLFDLDKLKLKVDNPKEFFEGINFLKCFDIALKNNNEKIAKYLLEILSFYTFNLNTKVEDPKNDSNINKIDDKFNKKFLVSDSLDKLDTIKIIKKLSEFFNKNSKKEKYQDRDYFALGEEFKGGYELFLNMERKYFYDTFENLVKNELYTESNLKTFNQIFLKIYVEVFFQFEWFDAIEFFFDQCKMYTELELKEKKVVLAHGPPGPARSVFESPARASPGRKKARAGYKALARTRKARAGPGQPPGFFYKSNL
jgi:hypothetical protein